MVPEHPNSGELELFIMPRPCLGNAKKNASCLPTILLVLRGVGSGQPTNNKHLEQQSGFGAAACRHAVTRTAGPQCGSTRCDRRHAHYCTVLLRTLQYYATLHFNLITVYTERYQILCGIHRTLPDTMQYCICICTCATNGHPIRRKPIK
jgi:hypothetical protein